MNLETVSGCNLRCTMCPIGTGDFKRKPEVMKDKLFKKIIDEAKGNIRYVWLHWFGEPLLDPKIGERIKYCEDAGIKTQVSTNATLLNKKKAKEILESGLDEIILSLDGATKRTYEKIRRRGDFEKTMKNVEEFLKMKKKLGFKKPYAKVQAIRMDENEKEMNLFINKWKDLADEVVIKPIVSWAGQVDVSKLSKEKRRKPKRYACFNLWDQLTIGSNGKAGVCCYDFNAALVVGDLNKQSIAEVFNGKKLVSLRKMQAEGKYNYKPCKTCIEWAWLKEHTSLGKTFVREGLQDLGLFKAYSQVRNALKGNIVYLPGNS